MNNHAFKIFKNPQVGNSLNRSDYNMPPVQDISFHIHYQNKGNSVSYGRGKDTSRPRLDDIMAEYRRVNKLNRQRK